MTFETTVEIVNALAAAPGQVEDLVRQAEARGWQPEPPAGPASADPWTASEIVGHLCDAARIYGGRIRRIVYEQDPHLETFDEGEQVRHGGYRYKALGPLMQEFRMLSEGNVAFLRELPPEAWQRTAEHAERGRMTLRDAASVMAEHERLHVRQLAEALGTAESR